MGPVLSRPRNVTSRTPAADFKWRRRAHTASIAWVGGGCRSGGCARRGDPSRMACDAQDQASRKTGSTPVMTATVDPDDVGGFPYPVAGGAAEEPQQVSEPGGEGAPWWIFGVVLGLRRGSGSEHEDHGCGRVRSVRKNHRSRTGACRRRGRTSRHLRGVPPRGVRIRRAHMDRSRSSRILP